MGSDTSPTNPTDSDSDENFDPFAPAQAHDDDPFADIHSDSVNDPFLAPHRVTSEPHTAAAAESDSDDPFSVALTDTVDPFSVAHTDSVDPFSVAHTDSVDPFGTQSATKADVESDSVSVGSEDFDPFAHLTGETQSHSAAVEADFDPFAHFSSAADDPFG